MIRQLARRVVDATDRAGGRRLIASGASLIAGCAGRDQRFTVDEDGDWVNSQTEATFVSPDTLFSQYWAKRAEINDLWCYQYAPQKGDTVIDVGAGIGDEAVVFSRMVGPRGHVYAIEAHPRTFTCLEKTIARSRLENVTALNCAVADCDGMLTIEDSDAQNHISHSLVKSSGAGIEVRSYTLDKLLANYDIGQVDLLKMNIEGAERLAIRGINACASRIAHYAISCHDFVADRDGAEELRTSAEVTTYLANRGLKILRRLDDPRPWVRDYLYAKSTVVG